MNLTDFSPEIVAHMCSFMNLSSINNFQKTCWYAHNVVKHGKAELTSNKMEEWRLEMRIVFGMSLLKLLMQCNRLDLINTFRRIECISIFKNGLIVNSSCIRDFRHFLERNEKFKSFLIDAEILHDLAEFHSSFMFEMNFPNHEIKAEFLYNLYMYFVAKIWQKKNLDAVVRYRYKEFGRLITEENFYEELYKKFRGSMFLNFSSIEEPSKEKHYFSEYVQLNKQKWLEEFPKYFHTMDQAFHAIQKK